VPALAPARPATGTPLRGLMHACLPPSPPPSPFPTAAELYAAVKPTGDEAQWEGECPQLRPELRPYQRRAVAWMLRREAGQSHACRRPTRAVEWRAAAAVQKPADGAATAFDPDSKPSPRSSPPPFFAAAVMPAISHHATTGCRRTPAGSKAPAGQLHPLWAPVAAAPAWGAQAPPAVAAAAAAAAATAGSPPPPVAFYINRAVAAVAGEGFAAPPPVRGGILCDEMVRGGGAATTAPPPPAAALATPRAVLPRLPPLLPPWPPQGRSILHSTRVLHTSAAKMTGRPSPQG
jgi:hypothetical protein